jgi:hypothetical protein
MLGIGEILVRRWDREPHIQVGHFQVLTIFVFFWGVPTCLKAQIIPSPKDRLGEVVDTQILLAAG